MTSISTFSLILGFFGCLFDSVSAQQSCKALDQCSCQLDDGKIISLWDIDSRSTTTPRFTFSNFISTPSVSYSYSPCTGFTSPGYSNCKNVLVCQSSINAQSEKIKTALAYPTLPSIVYDDLNKLYKFTYAGSGKIKTSILLVCDLTAKVPTMLGMLPLPNQFVTTLTSECACPGICKYSGGGSSGKKHGLSTGSILCIVLLVLLVVYVVGGMLIGKYVLKKEGSDIIPQKTFWSGLPVLIKDGVVFTISKIKGTKGQYEQI